VDFLLVIIELFSLDVTAEALRANIDRKSAISLQRGHFDPKFQDSGNDKKKSVPITPRKSVVLHYRVLLRRLSGWGESP